MRPYLRTAALCLAAASLIYFGSCERHKPEELSHGEHARAEPGHGAGASHEHPAADQHSAEHPAASPVGTPAQFFPSPTP